MRSFFIASIVALVALSTVGAASTASAFDGGHHFRGRRGAYFGNGGHDTVPHWHRTTTPFGTYRWYGQGAHDYQPHWHRYNGHSYRGYSVSPFGVTRSYYPRYPSYYSW